MNFAIEMVIIILSYIDLPKFEEIKLYLNALYKKSFIDK